MRLAGSRNKRQADFSRWGIKISAGSAITHDKHRQTRRPAFIRRSSAQFSLGVANLSPSRALSSEISVTVRRRTVATELAGKVSI